MIENENKPQRKQVCTIRIMFPVDTDEQAIECKKKISDVLTDIPQARTEFNLASVPYGVDLRPANR